MESICRLCFQPATLFQVPGYNLPTCVKCSEQLSSNGIPANFYQARQDVSTNSAMNSILVSENLARQQQQQQQQQQPENPTQAQESTDSDPDHRSSSQESNLSTANNAINCIPGLSNSQKGRSNNIVSLELAKTLQNIDVDLLFNEEGTCPLCSKTFSRKSSLLTHIRNHSAERKYVCTYCQKGFTQAANLRNHERIHTNDRPYVCVDCGKAFTQITNLNNHRRLHTGERPFVCIEPDCGRSFAQVTNLNNHMKTHHKVQQYCCNQCPKKFTQVTSLNQHLQVHAGISGYYCPRCPEKTFRQQSQLHTHMKSHGLAFPYECQKCEEKFLQQAHLDQHNRMHEEFKFKCDMCPSSFNQEMLLKKHIQRHIEGRYITCPVPNCNQGFAVKQHLSKHLLTRHSHNELPPPKRSKKSHHQNAQLIGHQMTPVIQGQGRGRPKKKSSSSSSSMVLNNGTNLTNTQQQMTGNNIGNAAAHVQHNGLAVQIKNNQGGGIGGNGGSSTEELRCRDCGVVFPNEDSLSEHIFYKHPERRFMQAILEDSKYRSRTQTQQEFVCNFCCNCFKSHMALVRHTTKFHGQAPKA